MRLRGSDKPCAASCLRVEFVWYLKANCQSWTSGHAVTHPRVHFYYKYLVAITLIENVLMELNELLNDTAPGRFYTPSTLLTQSMALNEEERQ